MNKYMLLTCPPGPELLEKDNSTDPRVMGWDLKEDIHKRASFASSEVDTEASWGAMGRAPVLEWALRMTEDIGWRTLE